MHNDLKMQNVLDKGYVKFIDSMGSDESVISAARMSTARGFERWDPGEVCRHCRVPREKVVVLEKRTSGVMDCHGSALYEAAHEVADFVKTPGDTKLLEYLYANGHMTPFEMGQIHIEVYAPILTFRQWHRHRVFSYNEMSGRYGPLPDDFYVPSEERLRDSLKASVNKQAGGKGEPPSDAMIERLTLEITGEQRQARGRYEGRLNLGMAPELARINVPVSQYSKCRVSGDLRCWLDSFLRQRLDSHAQAEIREPANAAAKIVQALFPRSYALFEEYTLGGVRFSRTEIAALREWIAVDAAEMDIRGHAEKAIDDKAKRTAFLKKLGLEG